MFNFLGDNPSNLSLLFFATALGGTFFFFMRVVMVLVIGMGGEEMMADGDVVDGMETEGNLKMFSFNAIGAFLMMFGWMGLTSYNQFGLGPWLSTFLALLVGTATMYLTAWAFSKMRLLESSGATFDIQKTVGETAEVYQEIPKAGVGKIHITVDGILREIMAESLDGKPINSFQMVEITGVRNQALVLVKPRNS